MTGPVPCDAATWAPCVDVAFFFLWLVCVSDTTIALDSAVTMTLPWHVPHAFPSLKY